MANISMFYFFTVVFFFYYLFDFIVHWIKIRSLLKITKFHEELSYIPDPNTDFHVEKSFSFHRKQRKSYDYTGIMSYKACTFIV